MHKILTELTRKPDLFECFDTAALWTDPHVATEMLRLHLDDTSALASRPFSNIDAVVEWLDRAVRFDGRQLVDLGCGPGLYSERFQARGASVTGIDISASSIDYARGRDIPNSEFLVGNYHSVEIPDCDVVTLIYGDICAMPELSRAALFRRIHASLGDGGVFILDCFAPSAVADRQDVLVIEQNLDAGFWAPGPYFGLKQTFVYRDDTTVLDKYLIVEESGTRWVHNWLQHMTPEQLSIELEQQGFSVDQAKTALTGEPWTEGEDTFCILARKGECQSAN